MPFEIDAFRASPAVQAMHPCARAGYLYLLADAWQTDDCTIPADPIDLADKSGLGDELWAVHGPRILRKFDPVEGTSKLRNAAQFKRWEDAKKVYDGRHADPDETRRKRSDAGRKGNEKRWGKGEGSQTGRKCDGEGSQTDPKTAPEGSQTGRYTETGTKTETKKQKPSRAKSAAPTKTALAESRHAEFKAALKTYWDSKNPGVEMPWDGAEGKQLGMWLKSSPAVTIEQFTGWLRNRFKSDVIHSERPSRWITNVTNFANGPVDRYNKPIAGGSNHAPGKQRSEEELRRLRAITEQAIAAASGNPAVAR